MTLYQQGYCDGVEGKTPQYKNHAYRAGYRHGADPQTQKSDEELFGQAPPRSGAWGLDYRNVSVDGFDGWAIMLTRLSDGRMLACWHSHHRPQVHEVRKVLARGLLHHEWPDVLWVDEWLSQFAAAECEKYGIRMHIRMFRKGGIERDRNEYDARLDRVMHARRDRFRPTPPTPPTSAVAVRDGGISHHRLDHRLEAVRRHWMN